MNKSKFSLNEVAPVILPLLTVKTGGFALGGFRGLLELKEDLVMQIGMIGLGGNIFALDKDIDGCQYIYCQVNQWTTSDFKK